MREKKILTSACAVNRAAGRRSRARRPGGGTRQNGRSVRCGAEHPTDAATAPDGGSGSPALWDPDPARPPVSVHRGRAAARPAAQLCISVWQVMTGRGAGAPGPVRPGIVILRGCPCPSCPKDAVLPLWYLWSRPRETPGCGWCATWEKGQKNMTAPRPRIRQPEPLDAGILQAEISSFALHLAAGNKSAKTVAASAVARDRQPGAADRCRHLPGDPGHPTQSQKCATQAAPQEPRFSGLWFARGRREISDRVPASLRDGQAGQTGSLATQRPCECPGAKCYRGTLTPSRDSGPSSKGSRLPSRNECGYAYGDQRCHRSKRWRTTCVLCGLCG